MRELINFCLKGDEMQFVAATKFDAAWTDKNKINFR